jgi:squalene-associated FAD-dependent desaturase
MTTRVAVVGGGLAGITAALACGDAGANVVLLEARASLGGLTNSFRRGSLSVDNGQHVFLRCCSSYRRLLDRLGVADKVALQPRLDIEVRMPGGRRGRLRRSSLPAPLHLGGALLGYSPLGLVDRLRIVRGAVQLRGLDLADKTLDDQTFGAWLSAHGQNQRTVSAMWDLFTVATLNCPAAEGSLALATMVFQTGLFADAAAGDIGWSLVPLQELHGEAGLRALIQGGAEVRTKAKVDTLTPSVHGWVVTERGGATHEVDKVVLAVPPGQAERLLPPGSVGPEPGWSDRLGAAPIVNAHVVYHRPVMEVPFVAGIGTVAQWVFDRTRQSGVADGQYVAVSISAADGYIDEGIATVRDVVLSALNELFPAARRATVLDFFVTRERSATFRQAPGTAVDRPGPDTRHPGLALAGAWTATGWPATMESAVRSGEAAAAALRLTPPGPAQRGTDQKGFMAA